MKVSKLITLLPVLALSFSLASCSSTQKSESEAPAPKIEAKKVETPELAPQKSVAAELKTIYFDFDKYIIRDDQIENANAIASVLKANQNVKIQIQGNTDDRGSVEYNMALGIKRADSLKKYLITQGVAENNISVVSYGKERPAAQGADESVWSKNRRDDVVEQN